MDLQDVIMRLNQYWAEQGCLLWQPYNVQVGAGTGNPATALRVLGPEPWKVAYVEPSVRPDDGRYGENPNRWQEYYQYQVILKPDPGNPQELYLDSLRALGIDTAVHDVRFVEDNWESPALGAWGLGWEVWLDGQEISQYTYFQQAGGQEMNPVSVELTYGLERIVMVLQGVRTFPEMAWRGAVTYGDLRLRGEIEHCTYNFQIANVERLRQLHDLCEAEAKEALAHGLVLPAHDYVLKCSHLFNVLDARGAIGVTERARYFVRMRDLSREVATLYVKQREEMGYPLNGKVAIPAPETAAPLPAPTMPDGSGPWDLLLEIGSEELPVGDLDLVQTQLRDKLAAALQTARLPYAELRVSGTPRRTVAQVRGVERQREQERVVRGPQVRAAYDADGQPTKAALGFARSQGLDVSALQKRTLDGKDYVVAALLDVGRDPATVLAELLPTVIGALSFPKSMRWNASGVSYSRPLRWFVALLHDQVIPFEYAGIRSGRTSRGNRSFGSPSLQIACAACHERVMAQAKVMLDVGEREASILAQVRALASEAGGEIPDDPDLLREVANLVEYPLAIRGDFAQEYLRLPGAVLLAVMRKHQRYFPVLRDGTLLPCFITVANGANLDVSAVRYGNEEVLRARYADAAFFFDADSKQPLDAFTPKLASLTFQERLGSVLDKVARIQRLTPQLGARLGLSAEDLAVAARAAALCKSDLATQLVVEITSLQGIMGRVYAERCGELPAVAQAIEQHYWPRAMGDKLPQSMAAVVVSLADRLDSLVGLFAVGIRPTGAADPWGLRRAALGLVQLLVGKEISLDLGEALALAATALPLPVSRETLAEALDYVAKRYRGYLLDSGLPYDQVDAVLAARGRNPYAAYRALGEFGAWVKRPEWEELLDSYARCVRITRDLKERLPVERGTLGEPAAVALYDAYLVAAGKIGPQSGVGELLQVLAELKPAITRFFSEVLVMAEDAQVRTSRLGLLQAIGALPAGIVDLTVMEGF